MKEKLVKLEERIEILERELQQLKSEVDILKDKELVEEECEGPENFEFCKKMFENIVPAFEIYEEIRHKAQKEGVKFNGIRGGIFAVLLRRSKHYSGYIKKLIANGEETVYKNYFEECINGKHPKLYRLLTSEDSSDIELIKAAILEEIEENNYYTDEAYSYEHLKKFKRLVSSAE